MKIRTERETKPSAGPSILIALVVSAITICSPHYASASLDSSSTTLMAKTKPARTGYKLLKAKLASGRSVVARWNPCQSAVTYRVNLSDVSSSKRASLLAQIKTAFIKLSHADGMTYRYTGATTFVPRAGNLSAEPAEIVVAAVTSNKTDLGSTDNSLGFGGVMWSTWSGDEGENAAVVRGYVVLNPAGMHTLRQGFGKGQTEGNVILHELGHATGLDHVNAKGSLMNPTLTSSAPNGYSDGDLAGLRKVGITAGCITIPAAVKIADLS